MLSSGSSDSFVRITRQARAHQRVFQAKIAMRPVGINRTKHMYAVENPRVAEDLFGQTVYSFATMQLSLHIGWVPHSILDLRLIFSSAATGLSLDPGLPLF